MGRPIRIRADGRRRRADLPDGEPGLTDKIVRLLELARERQAALILAMPQKYRGLSQRDRPLSGGAVGGGTELGGYGSDAHGGSGYGATIRVLVVGRLVLVMEPTVQAGRGGWADGSSSDTAEPLQGDGSQSNGTGDRPALSGNGPMGFGEGSTPGTNPKGTNPAGSGGESLFGSAGSGSPAGGGSQAGNRSSSSANSSSSNAAGGAAGGSGGGSQMSGSQMAMPSTLPTKAAPVAVPAVRPASPPAVLRQALAAAPGSTSQPPDDMNGQQASPQLSLNKNFNGQRQESTAPVASRRGRGWAWSQGPPSQTSVGRSIRLQCLADRWIVLPDSGKANDPSAIAITFDLSPQQRAERLAQMVAERVDSWGLRSAVGTGSQRW
ncbi:MAG: hypothetical protein R3C56_07105 [Pirellulaceae bacterium]